MLHLDPYVPYFEGHYRELLSLIRVQASYVPPNLWLAIVTAKWEKGHDEMERQRIYCEKISLLPFLLMYSDLPGIDPLQARVIVLARLLGDRAPISYLQEEFIAAMADAIEARSSEKAVLLFSARMQPLAHTDGSIPVAPAFDMDRWSKAMAQNVWGTA